MLIRLFTNKDEFKPIDFKPGFNAIVADRAADSTDQNSRNARGKSTLLMFLNWVLASNRPKSLQPLAENDWEISLTLEMFGGVVTATRPLNGGSRIALSYDQTAGEVLAPYVTEGTVSLDDWKELLGLALFRLEPEEEHRTGGLSTRTLLSYVIRSDTPKDPFKVVAQQGAVSSRQHVAFLLGLDWEVIHQLANIKKGLEQLKTITAASRDGLVSTLRPEEELLLERAALRNEAGEWAERISGFRVLDDPSELIVRADELTAKMAELRDASLVDRRLRELYNESLAEPLDVAMDSAQVVADLAGSAGLVLADGFVMRLQEVEQFHAALLQNRRAFLQREIETLDAALAARARELDALDERRDNALRTLEAGGAFEELNAMRGELAEVQARAAAVDLQIEQARELVTRKEELKLERATRRQEATLELAITRDKLDQVGDRFSAKMRALYAKDAALSVTVDDSGYQFSLKVTGSGSTGVDRMTLFCFDLTMLEEGVSTAHHPDFLVHDSTVFDGVDPRQRAGALFFAQQMVQETGGQYICTINSNDIPEDVANEGWFVDGVVRTILDTEAGGLVGREF